jgi:hypothetical protein
VNAVAIIWAIHLLSSKKENIYAVIFHKENEVTSQRACTQFQLILESWVEKKIIVKDIEI